MFCTFEDIISLTRRGICFRRRMRFDRYLTFRNLNPGSSRGSRIVRNQDRNPIVDEEFIDDELTAMEDIG